MSLDRMKNAKKRTIGSKQTTKAIQKGTAILVYLAKDADSHVIEPLVQLCKEKNIEVVDNFSMIEIGKACGIEVGAASVAILAE